MPPSPQGMVRHVMGLFCIRISSLCMKLYFKIMIHGLEKCARYRFKWKYCQVTKNFRGFASRGACASLSPDIWVSRSGMGTENLHGDTFPGDADAADPGAPQIWEADHTCNLQYFSEPLRISQNSQIAMSTAGVDIRSRPALCKTAPLFKEHLAVLRSPRPLSTTCHLGNAAAGQVGIFCTCSLQSNMSEAPGIWYNFQSGPKCPCPGWDTVTTQRLLTFESDEMRGSMVPSSRGLLSSWPRKGLRCQPHNQGKLQSGHHMPTANVLLRNSPLRTPVHAPQNLSITSSQVAFGPTNVSEKGSCVFQIHPEMTRFL